MEKIINVRELFTREKSGEAAIMGLIFVGICLITSFVLLEILVGNDIEQLKNTDRYVLPTIGGIVLLGFATGRIRFAILKSTYRSWLVKELKEQREWVNSLEKVRDFQPHFIAFAKSINSLIHDPRMRIMGPNMWIKEQDGMIRGYATFWIQNLYKAYKESKFPEEHLEGYQAFITEFTRLFGPLEEDSYFHYKINKELCKTTDEFMKELEEENQKIQRLRDELNQFIH